MNIRRIIYKILGILGVSEHNGIHTLEFGLLGQFLISLFMMVLDYFKPWNEFLQLLSDAFIFTRNLYYFICWFGLYQIVKRIKKDVPEWFEHDYHF